MSNTEQAGAEHYEDLTPEQAKAEFAGWAKLATSEELTMILAVSGAELQARGDHPAQQGAAKVQDQINAQAEANKKQALAASGSAALHNAGSKQPPVDNDHAALGATQFTAAEIAANKPAVAPAVAPAKSATPPAAPAAPVKAWHEDV